jgi:hypothetical protein
MKVERFTFVKHKLTGQKMYVIDTGVIIARIAVSAQNPNHPDIPGFGFETVEVNEEEVEAITED